MTRATDTARAIARNVLASWGVALLTAASASAAPKQPAAGSLVVRGAVGRKIPGDPGRVYYATKRDQPVAFEVYGPTVLVLDVQPRRSGPSSGSRFAVTLDAKDVGWVDVSCKAATSRLVPDPSGEPCAAVQRRFELGKGKHRLSVRLVVGEIAVIVPHTEAIVAKSNEELDLAPIVSATPGSPAPGATSVSAPEVASATAPKADVSGADLELAPIARPTTAKTEGQTPSSSAVANTPSAARPAPGASSPPVEPVGPPSSAPDLVALRPAGPSTAVDAQGPARPDLVLSPKTPGSQFAFLAKPTVWGPAAGGAAALGVAAYFGTQSRSSFNDAKSPVSQTAARTSNNNGIRQAKTANVLFAVGGVAMGVAVVLSAMDLMARADGSQGGS